MALVRIEGWEGILEIPGVLQSLENPLVLGWVEILKLKVGDSELKFSRKIVIK